MAKYKKWTKVEQDFLVENYPVKSTKELCKEMGRTETNIESQAGFLGLKKSYWYWSEFEIDFLKDNYETKGPKFVSDNLGREYKSTCTKGNKLGLKTKLTKMEDQRFVIYKQGEIVAQGTRKECAKKLGIKEKTITWYSTENYKERLKKRKNPAKGFIAERFGVEEYEKIKH